MIEPMGFKTNIGLNSAAATEEISDYDTYRTKIAAYTKQAFDKAPGPEPVIDVVVKCVNDPRPRFNHPVGKGASIVLTLQRFAYSVFENSILKGVNAAK
jgi:hypothetical protein